MNNAELFVTMLLTIPAIYPLSLRLDYNRNYYHPLPHSQSCPLSNSTLPSHPATITPSTTLCYCHTLYNSPLLSLLPPLPATITLPTTPSCYHSSYPQLFVNITPSTKFCYYLYLHSHPPLPAITPSTKFCYYLYLHSPPSLPPPSFATISTSTPLHHSPPSLPVISRGAGRGSVSWSRVALAVTNSSYSLLGENIFVILDISFQ